MPEPRSLTPSQAVAVVNELRDVAAWIRVHPTLTADDLEARADALWARFGPEDTP